MKPLNSPETGLGVSERFMLLLVSAVQFVNILDFMIVMPLGPDFAKDLGIPISQLGLIGGSYTGAAAISGALGSKFLDRFDRRDALAVTMFGLVLGTVSAGFAWNLPALVFARVIAGVFGGPATSIALSVIADIVPPARRGRALGIVMGAFGAASVFGVPLSLELARIGGWRLPFFAVAGLGLLVAGGAIFKMPALKLHFAHTEPRSRIHHFLAEPSVALSLCATLSVMLATFSVIPNLSAYIQHNRGYPRENLGALYLVGGAVSYVAMRAAGMYIDKFGATLLASLGTVFFVAACAVGFVYESTALPVMVMFVTLMTAMALRNVALNTRFMSLQNAMQHVGAATGAMLSSSLLEELPDKRLSGMPVVATFSVAMAFGLPLLLRLMERQLQQRETPAAQPWTVPAEVARASIPPG
jgi:predicted MFS family arabinose efflux permease